MARAKAWTWENRWWLALWAGMLAVAYCEYHFGIGWIAQFLG